MEKGYKVCPYCGEKIKEIAKKCRFCHEFLKGHIESDDNFNGDKIGLETDKFNKQNQESNKKTMTYGKRFGKYILYLFRDWIIFLVVDGITQGFGIWRYNTYADSHFAFDMFVCFIIFVVETVRLISDCSKIKKGTYGE